MKYVMSLLMVAVLGSFAMATDCFVQQVRVHVPQQQVQYVQNVVEFVEVPHVQFVEVQRVQKVRVQKVQVQHVQQVQVIKVQQQQHHRRGFFRR